MSDKFTAAADKEYRYVVLTREGDVQILFHPTASALREHGEQGWNRFRAIETQPDAWRLLQETLRTAVPDPDARIAGPDPEGSRSGPPRAAEAGGHYPMDLDAWCHLTLD